MKFRSIALRAVICASVPCAAAAAPPAPRYTAPYTAIEVDIFVADNGVAFPSDRQRALVEDIAREASITFQTVIILREGDPTPNGHAVLRISGTVTRFKPGNRAKRYLIGFGAGATVIQAQVRFADAATGQVLMIRKVQGTTWTGIAGGDSQGADDSLAKKIVKLCNAAHLVGSN
jgi:hypothetical protein